MTEKEKTLTLEEYKKICVLNEILLKNCTSQEQADQIIQIIEKTKKEKLCNQPTTAIHS